MKKSDYEAIANFYGNERQEWTQFRKCQAWESRDLYNSVYDIYFSLVKSYNTIVALAIHSEKKFVILGKWSRTTSKQCTQIHNSQYADYEIIQF